MSEELTEKEKKLTLVIEIVGPIEVFELEEQEFREYFKNRKEEKHD